MQHNPGNVALLPRPTHYPTPAHRAPFAPEAVTVCVTSAVLAPAAPVQAAKPKPKAKPRPVQVAAPEPVAVAPQPAPGHDEPITAPTHHDTKPHDGKQRDHSDVQSNPPSQSGDQGGQKTPTGEQTSQTGQSQQDAQQAPAPAADAPAIDAPAIDASAVAQ